MMVFIQTLKHFFSALFFEVREFAGGIYGLSKLLIV
jgi:hypothetical protein